MTHAPGFEEMVSEMAVRKAEDLVPLGDFLAAKLPARVYPPGELIAYSNYGTALAGYIVEVVSGMPFDDYKEETAKQMQTLLFTHDKRVNGNAHGFWELRLNNLRTIGHGGDSMWFHTLFILVPEKNLGFFVSYNSAGGGGPIRDQLLQAFLDRYYPMPEMSKLIDKE